jgi:hypothetical protein
MAGMSKRKYERACAEKWQQWKDAGLAPATRKKALKIIERKFKALGIVLREFKPERGVFGVIPSHEVKAVIAKSIIDEDLPDEQLNDDLSFLVWDMTENKGQASTDSWRRAAPKPPESEKIMSRNDRDGDGRMKKSKIITEKALIRRINARLAGTRYELSTISFYSGPPIDPNRKFQILDAIGRELGVLKPQEVVGEDDETARRRWISGLGSGER